MSAEPGDYSAARERKSSVIRAARLLETLLEELNKVIGAIG
jgi:hypothetical protein